MRADRSPWLRKTLPDRADCTVGSSPRRGKGNGIAMGERQGKVAVVAEDMSQNSVVGRRAGGRGGHRWTSNQGAPANSWGRQKQGPGPLGLGHTSGPQSRFFAAGVRRDRERAPAGGSALGLGLGVFVGVGGEPGGAAGQETKGTRVKGRS